MSELDLLRLKIDDTDRIQTRSRTARAAAKTKREEKARAQLAQRDNRRR